MSIFRMLLNPLYADDWYGIQWQEYTDSNEQLITGTPVRVGSKVSHITLPVQSQMKGCLLNADGTVNYYLDPYDWSKKADGTASDLTGTDGNVMVEIPEHWYKCTTSVDPETGNTVNTMLISPHTVDSTWKNSPRMYIGAYFGVVQNGVMKSISDGTSKATVSSINVFTGRSYARANNSSDTGHHWNIMSYDAWKTLWRFASIEFCSFNIQADFYTSTDANGFRQGGIGRGVTQSAYDGAYSQTICGYTNEYGNRSFGGVAGVSGYLDTKSGGNTSNYKCRYRGVENPFGEVWQWLDGVYVVDQTEAYVTHDPLLYDLVTSTSSTQTVSSLSDYRHFTLNSSADALPNSGGLIQTIHFGEYGDNLPKTGTTTWAGSYSAGSLYDGYWRNAGFRGLIVGGGAAAGALCGLSCAYALYSPAYTTAPIGSRLEYVV